MELKAIYVNSFCFCIDLRSGALLVGYLGIILSIFGFVEQVSELISTDYKNEDLDKYLDDEGK